MMYIYIYVYENQCDVSCVEATQCLHLPYDSG